jgi:hypothetical protein
VSEDSLNNLGASLPAHQIETMRFRTLDSELGMASGLGLGDGLSSTRAPHECRIKDRHNPPYFPLSCLITVLGLWLISLA